MTLDEILKDPGKLGEMARELAELLAGFVAELARNDLSLEFGAADGTDNVVDYDKPVSEAYRRDYPPIAAARVAQMAKEMAQHLTGENKVAGAVAVIKLFAIAGAI